MFHTFHILFYLFFYTFRVSNQSVLGIDSEIRIRLNLSNVRAEPNRRKADPAFGTKIDVYFPTSFVQFSQGNLVIKN